jgi:recombinational DNA repair ATPase RecF
MNQELRGLIERRLDREKAAPDAQWQWLVLAACDGRDALDAQLVGKSEPARVQASGARDGSGASDGAGVFLASITVEGFRGIGARHTLEIRPESGLTLIVGRNGSGKSSFAEGLEFLLTGESYRWKERHAEWKNGWRNLHHPDKAVIAATFVIDRQGEVAVTHAWPAGAKLDDGDTVVQPRGKPKTGFDSLGWTDALEAFRPFLSYNELGSMLDEGPSTLYDALSPALGLEQLVAVQETLRQARLERERLQRDAAQDAIDLLDRVRALVTQTADGRAKRAAECLGARTWDLAGLEALVTNAAGPDPGMALLQRAVGLSGPDVGRSAQIAQALRGAATTLKQLNQSAAKRSAELVDLLERALSLHEHFGDGECPVCATPGMLNAGWRASAVDSVTRLKGEANAFRAARSDLDSTRAAALALLEAPPSWLKNLAGVGLVEAEALHAQWVSWAQGRSIEFAGELATHLESSTPPLAEAVTRLVAQASAVLQAREDRWQPLALALAGWLPGARQAQNAASQVKALKDAEAWLKEASEEIRNERFAPIGARACEIWGQLRLQSNVDLLAVTLKVSGNQRRVQMKVTVDGIEGAALGVMSQGELNSLALSLFLPRASLPDTPFRFIVIDDPVQSMDPSRVEGLARVLADVAKTRQVIVFTHDDRLSEALRHLQLPARVLKVTRRTKSRVEVSVAFGPIEANLDGVKALAITEKLPADVARRVIPGFCRNAVEAACADAIRRRRRARGIPIEDVDRELEEAGKLYPLAALALFDDVKRTNDVVARLNQYGSWAGDTFVGCNAGVHDGYAGDVRALVDNTRRLADYLLKIKLT